MLTSAPCRPSWALHPRTTPSPAANGIVVHWLRVTTNLSAGAHSFLIFSVTHNKTCCELFGINYFSSILQSLSALGGIFIFKQFWGSFLFIFNIKDAIASVSKNGTVEDFVGLQTHSLH